MINALKEKFEKQIVIALFVVVTLIPLIAFAGLCLTIILLDNNILSWME